mmetsp:Transcript_28478/g.33760  ORF Transcript_28478/g.33760 Transcript_28478/m.33760 type:complete len:308 (+) Transcript_28478:171-1094(+)
MQLPSTVILTICLVQSIIPFVSSFTPQSQLQHCSIGRSQSTVSSSSSSPPLSLDAIVTTTARRRRNPINYSSSTSSSSLRAVADPPMVPASDHQDDKRKKKDDDNNNDEIGNGGGDEWTPMNGGFLPNILRRRRKTTVATTTTNKETPSTTKEAKKKKSKQTITIPNVTMIDNIMDYKSIVVDEEKAIVVVRFFASWCRSCRASEPLFKNMVSRYSPSSASSDGERPVKFVMVQLTKDTAYLQEGLGVPSIPYAHVYHPEGGLVEESKFSKGYYADFTRVLESYIAGSCDLPLEEEVGDDDVEGVFE